MIVRAAFGTTRIQTDGPRLKRPPADRRYASKAMASGVQGGNERTVPRIVICGGGIIGAATAHYLAEKGFAEAITVVERHEPACAASGKAGGFLSLGWNDDSPVGPLARLSYRLHEQLATQLGAERVGYRAVYTLQVVGVEKPPAGGSSTRLRGSTKLPDWVDGHVVGMSEMGDPTDTAQVHPHKLTTALLESAVKRGSRLLQGVVEGLQLEETAGGDDTGVEAGKGACRVTGVVVDGVVIPADVAVIAMGPWSGVAKEWLRTGTGSVRGGVGAIGKSAPKAGAECSATRSLLPGLTISGQKYHSVVLRPHKSVTNHMLFTGFKYASGRVVEPEVYPRPDGTVYVCGEPQTLPVPPSAAEVQVEEQLGENIRTVAGSLASCLAQAPVETLQACYLPCAPDGLPVIGPVPQCQGAFLATGHTCWGILNAPATGLVLAEMIAEGRASSCDVTAFSPSRFAGG
ncbi:hypothetical protein VaNZ11_011585 [Volvox africanus]|uniref:FAD dependent oxidoreductase domain-containing protein n=1 Tax=Volvox africanus TaxID=51714 RepID=A0ABQ5SD86_9CHLO|nr:hypothetical protein VaNZ11_011585 [Volvox africanus]